MGTNRGMLLCGALALCGCARSGQETPSPDAGAETVETIAGNVDLAVRVTLSGYSSERRIGAGAIVRVENGAGLFLETTAGEDGVAHPRVDFAKGPFDVTVAHPSSRTMLSIVGVTTTPVGDIALVTEASPHVGVTIHGALKGRTSKGRVFVDGPLFTTQNLPAGITSYTASAWRLPTFPLSLTAIEVDDKGAPLNAAFVPTMPRPSAETVLDLEFPSPAATPSRATMHLDLPSSGVLAASDVALETLVMDLPGAVVAHEDPGRDSAMMLGGGAVKGFGTPRLDVDAWWFPTDVAPNETAMRVRAGPYSGLLRLGPPSASSTKIPFAETAQAAGTSPDDALFDIDAREWGHALVVVTNTQRNWWIYSQGRGRLRRGLPHLPSGFSMLDFGGSVDLLPGVADDDRVGLPPWAPNARSNSVLRDKLTLAVTAPAEDQRSIIKCGDGPFVAFEFTLQHQKSAVANARVRSSHCPGVETRTTKEGGVLVLAPVDSTFHLKLEHPLYGTSPLVLGEFRSALPEHITRRTYLPPIVELGVSLPAIVVQPLSRAGADCSEFAGLEVSVPGGRTHYFDNSMVEHEGPMRGCGFAVVDGVVPGFAKVTVRNTVTGEVWLPEWMTQTDRTPVVAGAVTHSTYVKAP